MIQITITPASGVEGGSYRSEGHADQGMELVCNAVSAIEECLAANLKDAWYVKAERHSTKGSYELRWSKADRQGRGLPRANLAAGFAYNGLKALAMEYPEQVRVKWEKARRMTHETKRRDQ